MQILFCELVTFAPLVLIPIIFIPALQTAFIQPHRPIFQFVDPSNAAFSLMLLIPAVWSKRRMLCDVNVGSGAQHGVFIGRCRLNTIYCRMKQPNDSPNYTYDMYYYIYDMYYYIYDMYYYIYDMYYYIYTTCITIYTTCITIYTTCITIYTTCITIYIRHVLLYIRHVLLYIRHVLLYI